MGLNNIATKTTILTISALTLCSVELEAHNPYQERFIPAERTGLVTEQFNTQSTNLDYVEEQYSTPILNYDIDYYNETTFFNFIQTFNFPQKELDSEILTALNKFEKLTSKKTPTKKRL